MGEGGMRVKENSINKGIGARMKKICSGGLPAWNGDRASRISESEFG